MDIAKPNLALAISVVGWLATALPSAAQVSQIDVHRAESAIMSAGSRAAVVRKVRAVPSVGVIDVGFQNYSPFRDDNIPTRSEFAMSAQRHAGGIRALHRALTSNPVTRHALAEHGVDVSSVIGVEISSRGSLRLYVLR